MKKSLISKVSPFLELILILQFYNTAQVVLADTANLNTLQFVHVLIRHGDRTPEYAYANDPYQNESTWAEGWGQLTEIGKKQEYELGVYLRHRYGNFLSDKYEANEIYVLSSDLDRTIMSAQVNLAGLFPVDENQTNWNPDINWQPVPLHTIAMESDNILRMKRVCPRFYEIFDDFIHNSDMMKKINSENAELFKDLSRKSGENITTIMEIDGFYATLLVEKIQNVTLPEWAPPLFNDSHFLYLYNLSFAAKTLTPELQRLRCGGLLKYLMTNINNSISEASPTKFVMLSGHDITMVDLLNTLGVYNMKIPYYASAIMMELHRDLNSTANEDKFYFNLYLRNDSSRADSYKLTLPNCDFNCPLETIFAKLNPLIPEDWDGECQALNHSDDFSWLAILAIGLASAIFCSLLLASGLLLCKKVNQNKGIRRGYEQY